MSALVRMVRQFNLKFDRPSRPRPTTDLPEAEVAYLRSKLMEETDEVLDAIGRRDLVAIADGLADAIYVLAGIADQYGLDADLLLEVVHRSNMTKQLVDGVVEKGVDYRRPAVESAIDEMRRHRRA